MSAEAGFGCGGEEGEHRFLVIIPKAAAQPVTVVEDYGSQSANEGLGERLLRASIERPRWDMLSGELRAEFNRRLRGLGRRAGRWTSGEVPVDRLLGKELVLLAWGTEDAPLDKVPQAVANWLGLKPEERWWLYTTAAAATGDAIRHRGVGWRKALVIALTENPVTGGLPTVMRVAPRRKTGKRTEGDRASPTLFPLRARAAAAASMTI